ncbi:MAG: cysteine desulfurase [Bacteroidetes bacterium]|nr:MAG: cysteine desulfurase [Bacteroidota bacterium]
MKGKRKLELEEIRRDFPLLGREVHGRPLVYFDNGATTQKPKRVIDTIERYYSLENANIHRGVHYLSQQATTAYEEARKKVANFIGAASDREIIFTKGTTDSINLVAFSFGESLKEGDEILISHLEHHSNIVPWQMLCERKGCVLKVIPMNDRGELIQEEFEKLLSTRTKLLALSHVSNSLGIVNPVREMIRKARDYGARVLIDGAQSVQHTTIDVVDLDCDFYVFSGHKIYGPTGVGVLYGKESVLDAMTPYQGGGDMIKTVRFEKTTYNELPFKFEAGTPNIVGGIGLGAALDYLSEFDMHEIEAHEASVSAYLGACLKEIDGVRIYGESEQKLGVQSFLVEGIHPFDLGTILDQQGVAVRTGHHCTQPIMDFYQIPGTVRASFAMYNKKEEVDVFMNALERAVKMLK